MPLKAFKQMETNILVFLFILRFCSNSRTFAWSVCEIKFLAFLWNIDLRVIRQCANNYKIRVGGSIGKRAGAYSNTLR